MGAKPVLVICGPTASGKSALALDAAQAFGGTVINADSMQVYRELRVLTDRPSAADEARAPHRLYGVLPAAEPCSAGRWLTLATAEIEAAWAGRRLPVVTGGTGLYIKALMEGLDEIPEISPASRHTARARLDELGKDGFHALLAEVDPAAAARLRPSDGQRLVRAYEVWLETGRSIVAWQSGQKAPAVAAAFHVIAVVPPRDVLYAAIDARAERMMAAGALEEVRALMDLILPPDLPAMKALGVPEIMRHLAGEVGRADAVAALARASRNYAKRQITWFSHQIEPHQRLDAQYSERFRENIFMEIRKTVLTTQGW